MGRGPATPAARPERPASRPPIRRKASAESELRLEGAVGEVSGTTLPSGNGVPPDENSGNSPEVSVVSTGSDVNPDDAQLIADCLAGRTEAFGELVVRHQDRLYRTLVGVLGSSEDARDVAQDSFIHAFRKLRSFRGESAFYSWLFRIAMNAAASSRRKERVRSVSIDVLRERTGREPIDEHPAGSPSHALERDERRNLVRRALAGVSAEFREALVLKEIEELRYDQIAEALDVPIGTVRSRIHRGRAELREQLRILLSGDGPVR
jgi:RNA polymerase sigma-70 factor (ECF subfamily)